MQAPSPFFARRHAPTLSVFLAALHLSAAVPEAIATVHVVPDQFPAIQPAIDFASSGDTVLIRPGTYVESLALAGKDLTLLGEAGAALTTLTTNDLARILDIGAGVTSATLLTGLHFRNG